MNWLDKILGTGWRDTAERLFWTALSGAVATVPSILTDLPYWWAPILLPGVNWVSIKLRQNSPLPSPGDGLPALPTPEADSTLPPAHG